MSRVANDILTYLLGLVLGVITGWFLCGSIAHASEHMRISPCEGVRDYHQCAVIAISGDIIPEDRDEFLARTNDIAKARIDLSGPGGYARSAINIGEIIRARGFSTFVPADSVCESACAYIWLAGKPRTTGPKSVLMWHSGYFGKDDQHADGNGNALLGMYLAHMGYTYDDVDHMIGHDPNDLHAMVTDENGIQTRVNMRCINEKCVQK